jgi:sugar/nucleoside kinase (ribokinase family)
VGTVGASDGEWLLERLRFLHVDTAAIAIDHHEPTGLTVAVSNTQDRSFFTYSGANRRTAHTLELAPLPAARHIHLACVPTLRMMERLRRDGYTISVDVGWHPDWLADGNNAAALRLAHVFFPNDREAHQMCEWIGMLTDTLVVTKYGGAGAEARQYQESFKHTGFRVTVHDTTGAGDCFDAGFLHAWLNQQPLMECLRMGNACGALSTRAAGGVSGMPSKSELEEFLCGT